MDIAFGTTGKSMSPAIYREKAMQSSVFIKLKSVNLRRQKENIIKIKY